MNISADRRKNIIESIDLLSIIRDGIIIGSKEETYDSRLLMWIIEQLQQSLLVLDAMKNEST